MRKREGGGGFFPGVVPLHAARGLPTHAVKYFIFAGSIFREFNKGWYLEIFCRLKVLNILVGPLLLESHTHGTNSSGIVGVFAKIYGVLTKFKLFTVHIFIICVD